MLLVQLNITIHLKHQLKWTGQKQVAYPRKNWSSLILWNCEHPSNRKLTPEYVGSASAADLHRFKWLLNSEIGKLSYLWNWLEGEYDKPDVLPYAIHYTNGGPWFNEYKDCDYAELWNLKLSEIREPEDEIDDYENMPFFQRMWYRFKQAAVAE